MISQVAAAATERSAHVGHLVEATVFVAVALVAVSLFERRGSRTASQRVAQPAGSAALLVAAVASAGAAAIHLAALPAHAQESLLYGAFFLGCGLLQLGWSMLVMRHPSPAALWAGIVGSVAVLLLWAVTRTVGVPLGPEAGEREAVGVLDLWAGALELVVVLGAAAVLRGRQVLGTAMDLRVSLPRQR